MTRMSLRDYGGICALKEDGRWEQREDRVSGDETVRHAGHTMKCFVNCDKALGFFTEAVMSS